MSEHPPVDKYSKAAYEAGLAELSEAERKIKEHPLQAELAAHQELRKESSSPYPLEEEEAGAKKALEDETADLRAEIDKIKRDLWRQLGNAQAEAMTENDKIESKKLSEAVLPHIAKIEDNTQRRLAESGNLTNRAQFFGRAVLDASESARNQMASGKIVPSPEAIRTSFQIVQELYHEFIGHADVLGQNRFGEDAV